jgi:IS30 family transposase
MSNLPWFGSKNSQIATLVERQSRYVMLAKIGKKDTETVVNALIKHAQKLPHELYRSLTWDRGKEMADHRRFTLATDLKVYFCDPRSPWQRGSNENYDLEGRQEEDSSDGDCAWSGSGPGFPSPRARSPPRRG